MQTHFKQQQAKHGGSPGRRLVSTKDFATLFCAASPACVRGGKHIVSVFEKEGTGGARMQAHRRVLGLVSAALSRENSSPIQHHGQGWRSMHSQPQGGRLLSEQQVFVFRVTDFWNNELLERWRGRTVCISPPTSAPDTRRPTQMVRATSGSTVGAEEFTCCTVRKNDCNIQYVKSQISYKGEGKTREWMNIILWSTDMLIYLL